MNLKSDYKNVICIYKIICKSNGKIIIGSTTNLYNRINHYRNDINKLNPSHHYNKNLYNDIIKYGINNFEIEIIERFDDIDGTELKNKETYYMNLYNSLNPEIGYNIRQDIDGHCICSDTTREIKKQQTSEQWNLGIRAGHSDKMKDYWANNNDRRIKQSKLFTEYKTKYSYTIINNKTNEIVKDNILYKDLYLNGLYNYDIAQKFCYVNKKANSKNRVDKNNGFKNIINEIIVGEYTIRRTKI